MENCGEKGEEGRNKNKETHRRRVRKKSVEQRSRTTRRGGGRHTSK